MSRIFVPGTDPQGGVFSLAISIIGAFVTFLTGVLIACINYWLMRRSSAGGWTSFLPLLRLVISGAYLAAVYLLSPYTPCDPIWLLAGAALGLTIPLIFFTVLLLRQIRSDRLQGTDRQTNSDKGGDA